MDLAHTFCNTWMWNGTNGRHFAIFNVYVRTLCLPLCGSLPNPMLQPYRSACGISYANQNYLEWQAIQLAIHSIVST